MNHKAIRSLIEQARRTDDGPVRAPATEDEIDDYQVRTGVTLPPPVREWLMMSNGPIVDQCAFYGINDGLLPFDKAYAIFPAWHEMKWIPILDDSCGNYWVLPTRGEYGDGYPVVFVETMLDDEAPAYLVASSLGHFIEFVLEDEILLAHEDRQNDSYWPFERDKVLVKDPDMLKFHDVRLPWNP